jgi:biopolymer transport protein ExbD
MSKEKDQSENKPSDSFGLSAPSERIEELRREDAAPDQGSHIIHEMSKVQIAEAKFKQMGWKGIDDDEEVYEPEFSVKKEPIPEDELDMTPMVDVTFLLLIFFMVTASFTLQKSIEQPPAQSEAPSSNTVDEEIEDDYVEIIIDQTNTYYVTSRDASEVEAPSEREMRSRLKDAKENSTATRLIIRAHVDCMHRKVVTAWDAGIAVGMNRIEVQTTEEDF